MIMSFVYICKSIVLDYLYFHFSTCPEHVLQFVSLNFCIAIAKTDVVR